MDYTFAPATLEAMRPLADAFARTLTGPVDDFWESHILGGAAWAICEDGGQIGFLTLWDDAPERYISSFYLPAERWHRAQALFARALETFAVTRAYVPTCDELFLSLCMDRQVKVELQAYYFADTPHAPVLPPQFGRECLRPVTPDELPEVFAQVGDFFGGVTAQTMAEGRELLWRLCEGEETLGYGIVVPNRLVRPYAPCGEIVLVPHRRRGVARSLQMHLAAWCREQGMIPVGGCWYYNEASRNTFYSVGRYSKTRLLNITF